MTDASALDGATSRPPEGHRYSTPGEFAAAWNSNTDEQRQAWLEGVWLNSDRSMACFVRNHEGQIEYLTARVRELQDRLDLERLAFKRAIDGGDA